MPRSVTVNPWQRSMVLIYSYNIVDISLYCTQQNMPAFIATQPCIRVGSTSSITSRKIRPPSSTLQRNISPLRNVNPPDAFLPGLPPGSPGILPSFQRSFTWASTEALPDPDAVTNSTFDLVRSSLVPFVCSRPIQVCQSQVGAGADKPAPTDRLIAQNHKDMFQHHPPRQAFLNAGCLLPPG